MDHATTVPRAEMEEAFRNYFLTGPVHEDWAAWSRLFTDDARYDDHFWGAFRGPTEIQRFLEGTMSFAAHVYSPLMWYAIDRNRVVYQVVNRADNPGQRPCSDRLPIASGRRVRRRRQVGRRDRLVDGGGDEAVQPTPPRRPGRSRRSGG